MADAKQTSATTYSLLIELVVGKCSRRAQSRGPKPATKWQLKSFPVQDRPFYYGFRITSLSQTPFPGGLLHDLQIVSGEGKDIRWSEETTLAIPQLSPNHATILWVLPQIETGLSGTVGFACSVRATELGATVQTYQVGPGGRRDKVPGINHWQDGAFIYSQLDVRQSRTNLILLVLTIVTTVEALWGIRRLVDAGLRILGKALIWLGNLVS